MDIEVSGCLGKLSGLRPYQGRSGCYFGAPWQHQHFSKTLRIVRHTKFHNDNLFSIDFRKDRSHETMRDHHQFTPCISVTWLEIVFSDSGHSRNSLDSQTFHFLSWGKIPSHKEVCPSTTYNPERKVTFLCSEHEFISESVDWLAIPWINEMDSKLVH